MQNTTYIVTNIDGLETELLGNEAFIKFATTFYKDVEGFEPAEPFTIEVAIFYVQNFGGDTELKIVDIRNATHIHETDAEEERGQLLTSELNERDTYHRLLNECLVALNILPNMTLDASGFSSYDLVAKIETSFNQFKA